MLTKGKCAIIFLASLIVLEFLLFRAYALREILPYYPTNSDQTLYLYKSYAMFEMILNQGLRKAILMGPDMANSSLFTYQAAIFFLLTGATRFSALCLNFIYFAGLQLFGFYVIKTLTNRYSLAIIFIGFILMLKTTFLFAGGLMDFRIDFMAMCLYGIYAASILKSEIFFNRKWVVVAAIIAVFAILMRYILAPYIALTLFIIFIRFLFSYRAESRRIVNMFLFSAINVIIVAPFLWLNHVNINSYYVAKQLLGSEKYVRAAVQGVHNLKENLLYYPHSIVVYHLGLSTIITAIFFGVLLLLVRKFAKNKTAVSASTQTRKTENFSVLFLGLSILVPVIVLTADISKSPVVAGVIDIPALLFFVYIYYLISDVKQNQSSPFSKLLMVFASLSFLIGGATFASALGSHSYLYSRDNPKTISKMYMSIGNYAHSVQWQELHLGVDHVTEYLADKLVTVIYYDKTGTFITVSGDRFGADITSITKSDALAALNSSDVYITNLSSYPASPTDIYPYNIDMNKYRPELQQVAAQNMLNLGDFYFYNSHFRVYVKPDFAIYGISGGWITQNGIELVIPAKVANRALEYSLSGKSDFSHVPNLAVSAQYTDSQGHQHALLSQFKVANKQNYTLTVDAPQWKSRKPLTIGIKFSSYFIPEKLGSNGDTRELVILAPELKTVILRPRPVNR